MGKVTYILIFFPEHTTSREDLVDAGISVKLAGPFDGFHQLFVGTDSMDENAVDFLVARHQRDDRNEALKKHRRIYVNIARVQEGWCRLAGLDELANRLRDFSRGRKPTDQAEP